MTTLIFQDPKGEQYNLNRMDELGQVLERYDGDLKSLYEEQQLFRLIERHVNISVDFIFADDTTG